ncbi:MAG: hypothetical protein N4A40_12875 [Tissierellales bacterium]|jgi:hypothetical protein|nr:hypothetical protein [Tissierellales bacterium]
MKLSFIEPFINFYNSYKDYKEKEKQYLRLKSDKDKLENLKKEYSTLKNDIIRIKEQYNTLIEIRQEIEKSQPFEIENTSRKDYIVEAINTNRNIKNLQEFIIKDYGIYQIENLGIIDPELVRALSFSTKNLIPIFELIKGKQNTFRKVFLEELYRVKSGYNSDLEGFILKYQSSLLVQEGKAPKDYNYTILEENFGLMTELSIQPMPEHTDQRRDIFADLLIDYITSIIYLKPDEIRKVQKFCIWNSLDKLYQILGIRDYHSDVYDISVPLSTSDKKMIDNTLKLVAELYYSKVKVYEDYKRDCIRMFERDFFKKYSKLIPVKKIWEIQELFNLARDKNLLE